MVQSQLQAALLFHHLVDVALQVNRNLNSQHESPITVRDDRLGLWVRHDVGTLVAIEAAASQAIESHCDQLTVKKSVKEVLKCLSDALLWHRDLPKIALQQIWVRFHSLVDCIIFFICASIENLL